MNTKNCHYVAQSITKPWEHKLLHRDRQLRYYSFSRKKVSFAPSANLLSKYELLTPEEEKRFSKLIEAPIGKFKKSHFKLEYIDDYEIFRSLFLYFLFQNERFCLSINLKSSGVHLKELLTIEDGVLNTFTEKMRNENIICALNTVDHQLMFHSNLGYFSFPILKNKAFWVWGQAVPLFPNLALAMIPKGPSKNDIQSARKNLMMFSVGLNNHFDKIIIPPELREYSNKIFIDQIPIYRNRARQIEEQCNQMNLLVRMMYAYSGLPFPFG